MFPLYKKDIVMVMSDVPNGKALAKCFMIDEDDKYSLNQRICCIRSKEFYAKYLYYQLNRHKHFLAFNNGENQTNLRKSDILNCPLIKPSMNEQKRIVNELEICLSSINKAKANTEKNLQNAAALFESYLQRVFENKEYGWEEKKLKEISKTGAGGTPLKANKDYYEDGAVPWLLSGEVSQGEIFMAKNFITEKGLKNSSAKLFPSNTVLIAMYGATAGEVGILKFEAATNQAVCGILPDKNFIPEFLYYKFLSSKTALVLQAVGGAQPNISQVKIKNTLVPIISLEQQQNIVNQLDSLRAETRRLETLYQKKINALDELKKSLLQKAFEGELYDDEATKLKIENELPL